MEREGTRGKRGDKWRERGTDGERGDRRRQGTGGERGQETGQVERGDTWRERGHVERGGSGGEREEGSLGPRLSRQTLAACMLRRQPGTDSTCIHIHLLYITISYIRN